MQNRPILGNRKILRDALGHFVEVLTKKLVVSAKKFPADFDLQTPKKVVQYCGILSNVKYRATFMLLAFGGYMEYLVQRPAEQFALPAGIMQKHIKFVNEICLKAVLWIYYTGMTTVTAEVLAAGIG